MSDSISRDRHRRRPRSRGRSRSAGARSASSAACPTRWPSAARRSTWPTAATTPWPRSTSPTAEVRGFRHAGYFPTAVALGRDGKTAFVLNTKGNGSVSRTTLGKPGNAHDFQGTVTVVDLTSDLGRADRAGRAQQPLGCQSRRPRAEGLQRGDQACPLHHQGEPDLRRGLRRPARSATATPSSAAWARRSCPTTARSPASSPSSTTAT